MKLTYVALLLVAGCSALTMSRHEYRAPERAAWADAHPDSPWAELVRAGKIRPGMPKEIVEVAWGYPRRIGPSWTDARGTTTYWEYSMNEVWFRRGVVVEIISR